MVHNMKEEHFKEAISKCTHNIKGKIFFDWESFKKNYSHVLRQIVDGDF